MYCLAYGDKQSMYLLWPSANKISKARVDFPDPETPVIKFILFLGISISKFFKLFSFAPLMLTKFLSSFNMFSFFVLLIFLAVVLTLLVFNLLREPLKIISPPYFPALGPSSMIQSDLDINFKLCSMHKTEFWFVTNCFSDFTR